MPLIASIEKDSVTAISIRSADRRGVLILSNIERLADIIQKTTSISAGKLRNYGENGFIFALENISNNQLAKWFRFRKDE